MHDTNTEHGRINRGLILSFCASKMDDSSGDDRFSKFRAEKPVEMTVTVSNAAHQRESRARQRSHQERVRRHGQHRGHVPSARRGLFSQEVRVCSPSEQWGRRVGLSREDRAGRPKRQDHGPEVGDLHTLRGTLLAVEERSKSDSRSGVRAARERSQATHQGYEQREVTGREQAGRGNARQYRPYRLDNWKECRQDRRGQKDIGHQSRGTLSDGLRDQRGVRAESQQRQRLHASTVREVPQRKMKPRRISEQAERRYEPYGRRGSTLTVETRHRVVTRVVCTLEVDRIVRMGSETVSSAAQMEQQRDQPLSPVIPAPEAQENCSAAVENQGEPIRISFTELYGPQVGLSTHRKMIGAQIEQQRDQPLIPVIPALEAQENCSAGVENQGEPNQPIRISFTELDGPQVGLPTHRQMIGAQMDGQMSLEVSGEGQMGPLTHARMAATPAVVPVVDRTSSGVQRGGQVPPGTCDKSQKCPLCGQEVFSVKRHVEMEHLPWYFAPAIACWVCQECVENRCCLEERHKVCLHSLGGHFTEELQTMKELLHELAVLFGLRDVPALLQLCLRERLYPQDNGTTLSPTREAYMFWLEEYQGGAVRAVEIKPLNCSAAILN